jgi:N-methylhydantoinase A
MRVGVDTGGTFTDCVVIERGEVRILKVFTTPDDAARGIVAGISRLVPPSDHFPLEVIHGTTVGTNTLLQERGARVALVTTAGFEDLIEIGRQTRPRLYDFDVRRGPLLVPRPLRWGVRERIGAEGNVIEKLRPNELARLRSFVRRTRPEAVAVCFLFSFKNPSHERLAARSLRGWGIPVSVSHEILPEFREYERLSTVVINAYLAPGLGRYLHSLSTSIRTSLHSSRAQRRKPKKANASRRVFVMQSNGGITTAARAAREPVRTILSGPAGGVVAAWWLARKLGIERAISFDMGGTSTDVCLLAGEPRTTNETSLAGLPVAVPVLDVHSVGAGGGSMARFDAGGALRAGPESAGAVPGPICYGRGGAVPTVTDANLLLGRLDPAAFLGGEFRLDREHAARVVRKFLRASRAGAAYRSPEEFALAVVRVANATMEKALRVISVERGHDPRDFALVSFGGAGGLHAAELARALRLPRVVIPEHPGAFSALGILLSDIVKDATRSVLLSVPTASAGRATTELFLRDVERRFARLEAEARDELRREGLDAAPPRVARSLDVRYSGQAYELRVLFSPHFAAEFHRLHERAYGQADPNRPIEIVNLRVRLTVPTPKPPSRRARHSRASRRAAANSFQTRRPVWFGSQPQMTPFYARELLFPGARVAGPAVITEYSSTTVVPPGFVCDVDEFRNLVLTSHAI